MATWRSVARSAAVATALHAVLTVSFSAARDTEPRHPLQVSAEVRAEAMDRLQPRLSRLFDDGSAGLQQRRLSGDKAPPSLETIVVTCDFADSLMFGRFGRVPGEFPPPRQTDPYYDAHDSLYFHHLLGDVAAYYQDISGGRFTLHYTVHGRTVNLPQTMGWYGNHPEEGEQHIRLAVDVVESLAGEIDFEDYDTIILIHAGAGEETDVLGNSPEQIFSTYLSPEDFQEAREDSVLVEPYEGIEHIMVLPETSFQDPVGSFDGRYGSLGIYCFEVGLRLGMLSLSDFTPAGFPDSQGIGEFGLMGYGLFVAIGYVPDHPCAFNKLLMGWIDPPSLAATATEQTVTVRRADDVTHPLAAVRVETTGQEYWLTEYRLQDPNGNRDFDFPGDLVANGGNGNGIPDFYDASRPFGIPCANDPTCAPCTEDTCKFDPAVDRRESMAGSEWDFFMSENQGREPGVRAAGSGLYIWHVDEGVIQDVFGARRNLFNADPQRKSVDLEEADGIQDLDAREPSVYAYGGDDDSFRGEGASRFGPTTLPDTRTAGGVPTGIVFDDISAIISGGKAPAAQDDIEYAETMTFILRREEPAVASVEPVAARELPVGTDLAGSHLLAVDLDAAPTGGVREIVAAGHAGEVWALRPDLTEYRDWDGDTETLAPLTEGRDATGAPVVWNLPPAAGDIDADAMPELVLTGPDGLYAFETDGSEVGLPGPPAYGRLAPLANCSLPPVLLPVTGGETGDPTVAVVAAVVERDTDRSRLRFLTGEGQNAWPALDLGDVVVAAPPTRYRTEDRALLLLAVSDTVAGVHQLVGVSWAAEAEPAELGRIALGGAPGPLPVLADRTAWPTDRQASYARVVLADGRVAVVWFDDTDFADTAVSELWPVDLVSAGPLDPTGGLVGTDRFGVVEESGVWRRSWPVRPEPGIRVRLGAPTSMPLQARRGDTIVRLFTSRDGRIYLYDADGRLASGWPLAGPAAAAGTPLLSDLDDDGAVELVVAGAFPRITGIADGDSLLTEDLSSLSVWRLEGVAAGRSELWGGSAWRDGWDARQPAAASSAAAPLLVGGRPVCYPSPLTGTVLSVRGIAGTDCRVRAIVYNLEGEEVAASVARDVRPGDFELEVDLVRAVSGLYVCRLEAVHGGRRDDSVQAVAVVR